MSCAVNPIKGEPLALSQLSWAILNYEGGTEYARNSEEILAVPGAERLLLYLACLEEASAGRLSLDSKFTYTASHQAVSRSGILRWLEPPKPLALKDALAQMVITGDDIGFALSCEALACAGHHVEDFLKTFIGRVGLQGTYLTGVDIVEELPVGTSINSTAADLVGLIDSLGACAAGVVPRLDLTIDAPLAGFALDVLASVSARDGLSGYLPSYGPFHTRSCHLLVDGGTGSAWEAKNWTDVALVYREGRRAFAAAVICKSIPGEVAGLPGGYLARKTMAIIGHHLWQKQPL